MKADFLIIGGGIIGLSVAYHLRKAYPNSVIVILEKENSLAFHQSGRNSGVIHSGIYYTPGSLKAINCLKGKYQLKQFCKEKNILYEECGKLIVATNAEEENRLNVLMERAKANEIKCEYVTRKQIKLKEPNVEGRCGIFIPETGIVDYKEVCRCLQTGTIIVSEEVVSIGIGSLLTKRGNFYRFDRLFNCAGVYADRIAKMDEIDPTIQIVPFRGEYFTLRRPLCNGLVYPVPDPRFPFLGVHFTKMINGKIECGPNAVLALSREGYTNSIWSWKDTVEALAYSGTRKLMVKHWQTGLQQLIMSISKYRYLKELQKLIPAVRLKDLLPRPAGIRAQALASDGKLVDDFMVMYAKNVHVLNVPSPAATACLAIGQHVVTNSTLQETS